MGIEESVSDMIARKIFVSFLAGSGDYVIGVEGLAKSLRKVRSIYKLLVAVLPDVPEAHRRQLERQGCIVRQIEPIRPPPGSDVYKFAMAHYIINYSKLRIWEFEEYSKMVYLDADVMVFDNIDELFEMDGTFHAVLDCFCEWQHKPEYRSTGYCQQSPEKVPWQLSMKEPPKPYINGGVFVYEPSKATLQAMLKFLEDMPPTEFAEQDLLNIFFQNVVKIIPNKYNLVFKLLWFHPENVDLPSTCVVHYCADGSKPWRYTGKEENMDRDDVKELVNKWWDVYSNVGLDFEHDYAVDL